MKSRYTHSEALEILNECKLLREAVDALEKIAYGAFADEETDNVVVFPVRDSADI